MLCIGRVDRALSYILVRERKNLALLSVSCLRQFGYEKGEALRDMEPSMVGAENGSTLYFSWFHICADSTMRRAKYIVIQSKIKKYNGKEV